MRCIESCLYQKFVLTSITELPAITQTSDEIFVPVEAPTALQHVPSQYGVRIWWIAR